MWLHCGSNKIFFQRYKKKILNIPDIFLVKFNKIIVVILTYRLPLYLVGLPKQLGMYIYFPILQTHSVYLSTSWSALIKPVYYFNLKHLAVTQFFLFKKNSVYSKWKHLHLQLLDRQNGKIYFYPRLIYYTGLVQSNGTVNYFKRYTG